MPYINVDEAYVLDNTGLQVDDSVDYANANSNANLIDNWYFVGGGGSSFPINQRGASSYSGTGYTIDRWYISGSGSTTSVESDCVRFTAGATSNALLYQFFPVSTTGTFTISAYVRGTGGGYIGVCDTTSSHAVITTQSFSNVGANWTLVKRTFTTSTPIGGIRCRIDMGTSFDVQCIKLERGAYCTLMNDNPPDRALELAKCQYYFRALRNASTGYLYIGGFAQNSTLFRSYALPPMRPLSSGSPTVSYTGSPIILYGSSTIAVTGLTSSWGTNAEGGVTLFATVASGLTAYTPCVLRVDENSSINISCDL